MTFKRFQLVRGLLAISALTSVANVSFAAGPSEFVVYAFPTTNPPASASLNPEGNLVADSSGNLYGTSLAGGVEGGGGTVYELSRAVPPSTGWIRTLLYSFSGLDGLEPKAGLTLDSAGNLYGTTSYGGSNNLGVVFRLARPATEGGQWTESVLYSFQGGATDGEYPYDGVVFDSSGNLYGVTPLGGIAGGSADYGVVYKLAPPVTTGAAWTETVIHFFAQGEGVVPVGTPILDAKGNLYGATGGGGGYSSGLIYRLTRPASEGAAWTYKVLYSAFGRISTDARNPSSSLTLHGKGVLYGTTGAGGLYGFGTVFEVEPPAVPGGPWTENVLYSFAGGSDGATPQAKLTFDKAGNLYGTTTSGGGKGTSCHNGGCGTAFELTPPTTEGANWNETILHSFPTSKEDGRQPSGGLIFGKNGVLFGLTEVGGKAGNGAAFGIVP